MKPIYSLDDENFCFDSLTELIDTLKNRGGEVVGSTYYEIDCRPVAPDDAIKSMDVIEMWEERLDEIASESEELIELEVSTTAVLRLQQLLLEFAKTYRIFDGYQTCIGPSRKKTITQEDLE